MIDENEIETEEVEINEEPARPETAEETARAVWEELAEKAETEEPAQDAPVAPEGENPNEVSEAAKKLASARKPKRQTFVPEGSQAPQQAAPPVEKYEPPNGWPVEDKEWFMGQPPEVQKNAAKWFKDAQGKTTKIWQDLQRERTRAAEINQVAAEYLPKLKLPPGMTPGQAVKQLFEYQQKINTDSVGAIAEMMQHRGVTLQDLHAVLTGEAPRAQQQKQLPQQAPLTEEAILRILEQREARTQQDRAIQSATDEVKQLGQAVENGRYLWPELHEPANIQRIQPLISYIRETTPGIGWGEAYKKAIMQDRTNRGVGSPSPSGTRLTPENIQTVRQASSSLRSRGGNGAIARSAEPKANETARESAEAAYWEVFGNKSH